MKRLIFIILLSLAAATAARAETIYVQGDVSGTWSADSVIVTGEARVPPDSTLIIEPGVKVLFQVACKFIVNSNATLFAVGTLYVPIRFDRLAEGTTWLGIRFQSASSASQLAYCHISHGDVSQMSGPDANGGGHLLLQQRHPNKEMPD
jgi:hypothetical protein